MAFMALGGCGVDAAVGPVAIVSGASLVVSGRTPVDHVASWWWGMDCSAVRLERRQSWCAGPPATPPPVYCTASRGVADCWAAPPPTGAARQLADPPAPVP